MFPPVVKGPWSLFIMPEQWDLYLLFSQGLKCNFLEHQCSMLEILVILNGYGICRCKIVSMKRLTLFLLWEISSTLSMPLVDYYFFYWLLVHCQIIDRYVFFSTLVEWWWWRSHVRTYRRTFYSQPEGLVWRCGGRNHVQASHILSRNFYKK